MTIVSETHRFVFVHIPKTGGTSVKQALRSTIDADHFARSPETKHLRAREIFTAEPHLHGDDYFSFAFVRDPFARLLSYWSYKMENPFHPDYVSVVRAGSFKQWALDHVARGGTSQASFTHDDSGQQLVDFIGRYENLRDDFAMIAERIGCVDRELPHANASHHGLSGEAYDDELRSAVATYWRRDFDLFDYPF